MHRAALLLLLSTLILPLGCQSTPARLTPWVDPSPHRVRMVTVAPDVHLEVLDWGGLGEPVVFLAGLGNSAHVFDDFAPRFRDRYRPLAISRRGFGASTRSKEGYDAATRARDVVAVLDSLGIGRAVLAGHSLAGEEISTVATGYPNRVRALVYLDAYDYGEAFQRQRDQQPDIPELAPPPMTREDSASYAAVVAYRRRVGAMDYPEGEIRAHHRFGADGRLVEVVSRPHREVARGLSGSEYRRIAVPALAVYAPVPSAAELHGRAYARLAPEARARADSAFALLDGWRRGVVHRFRTEMQRGTVIEIPGADHYLFLSHPAVVERMMREFLARAAQ